MKKFKFRLEQVLHYRQIVRDEKKKLVAKAMLVLREAQERMEFLAEELAKHSFVEGRVMEASEAIFTGYLIQSLSLNMEKQKLVIAEATEKLALAQAEYIEASKDAKSLELLREKKHLEYQETLDRQEGVFLDEMAVMRSRRSS